MRAPTTAAVIPPRVETLVVSPAGQVAVRLYVDVDQFSFAALDDDGRLLVRPVSPQAESENGGDDA